MRHLGTTQTGKPLAPLWLEGQGRKECHWNPERVDHLAKAMVMEAHIQVKNEGHGRGAVRKHHHGLLLFLQLACWLLLLIKVMEAIKQGAQIMQKPAFLGTEQDREGE